MKIQQFCMIYLALSFCGNVGLSDRIVLKADSDSSKIEGRFTTRKNRQQVKLTSPKIAASGLDCVGSCVVILKFSNPKIPEIKVDGSIGGTLYNLGDLNNDGKDEIGILKQWFNGCWNSFEVYTFKYKKWELAVAPIFTHCNQWEANLKPIVKDFKHKGYVIITYSKFENNDIVFKTKSKPIK